MQQVGAFNPVKRTKEYTRDAVRTTSHKVLEMSHVIISTWKSAKSAKSGCRVTTTVVASPPPIGESSVSKKYNGSNRVREPNEIIASTTIMTGRT